MAAKEKIFLPVYSLSLPSRIISTSSSVVIFAFIDGILIQFWFSLARKLPMHQNSFFQPVCVIFRPKTDDFLLSDSQAKIMPDKTKIGSV